MKNLVIKRRNFLSKLFLLVIAATATIAVTIYFLYADGSYEGFYLFYPVTLGIAVWAIMCVEVGVSLEKGLNTWYGFLFHTFVFLGLMFITGFDGYTHYDRGIDYFGYYGERAVIVSAKEWYVLIGVYCLRTIAQFFILIRSIIFRPKLKQQAEC